MIAPWIHESNLIEGIDSAEEDVRSQKAYDWLLHFSHFTPNILRVLHKQIMTGLRPDIAGHFRTCDVYVGGRKCPPASLVPKMINRWMDLWGRVEFNFTSPPVPDFIKMAHIQFEYIHPFEDGNGRTGRMIMNWQRSRAGLEPLLIEYKKRYDYYAWFK